MKQKSVTKLKEQSRARRRQAIRKRLSGTTERPRLVVFRSLKHIYAQIIDDEAGRTLVSMSTKAKDFEMPPEKNEEAQGDDNKKKKKEAKGPKLGPRTRQSFVVGSKLAEKALAAGIAKVTFDRAGYKYHGRVKALAEGARKAGLQF